MFQIQVKHDSWDICRIIKEMIKVLQILLQIFYKLMWQWNE